jgi:hypothetical protein
MRKNFWAQFLFVGIFLWFTETSFPAFGGEQDSGNVSQDADSGGDDGSDDSGSDDGDSGDDDASSDDGSDSGGADSSDEGDDAGDDSSSDDSDDSTTSPNPPKWNDSNMSSGPLPAPPPQKAVECFGIMGPGQNDNVFVDVDGRQYGYGEAPACHPLGSIRLPKNSLYACENIVVGSTAKGELIRGSLRPNPDRRSPTVCYPYDFIKQKITYMNADYAIPLNGSN